MRERKSIERTLCPTHGEPHFHLGAQRTCWKCAQEQGLWRALLQRNLVQGRSLPQSRVSRGQLQVRKFYAGPRDVSKQQTAELLQAMANSPVASDPVTSCPLGATAEQLHWLMDNSVVEAVRCYDFADFRGLLNTRSYELGLPAFTTADFPLTGLLVGKLLRGEPIVADGWKLTVLPQVGLVWAQGRSAWQHSLACYLSGYSIEIPDVEVRSLKSAPPAWLKELSADRNFLWRTNAAHRLGWV